MKRALRIADSPTASAILESNPPGAHRPRLSSVIPKYSVLRGLTAPGYPKNIAHYRGLQTPTIPQVKYPVDNF